MTRSRLVLLVAVAVVAVIVAGTLVAGRPHQRPNLALTLIPGPAKAVIDGQRTVASGSFYVVPGRHRLTVSFNGFATRTLSFTTSARATTSLPVVLLPNSATGQQWLAAHPEAEQEGEHLTGTAYNDTATAREKANPIMSLLPYYERYFSIDYGPSVAHPDDETAIALDVTLYAPQGKQQALDWITQQGYDPSHFEITYIDDTTSP